MSGLPEPRRILVVMLRRIGDVLLTTPAVRQLRRRFPDARIDFLTEAPADELLRGNPDISGVLVYGGKGLSNYLYWLWRIRSSYDWVIDYMGNPRTAVLTFASGAAVKAGPAHVSHRWAYSHPLRQSDAPYYSAREKIRVLRCLGLEPDEKDCLPSLAADPAAEEWASRQLRGLGLERSDIVGFVPASRRVTRRWPAVHFARLGRLLRDGHGMRILVFWGPGERGLAEQVRAGIGDGAHAAPGTERLQELASLIGRCRMLVTNCSGPKHIAVARGVPTLTIHGSSDPVCWNPPGDERHPFVRAEALDCIGCSDNDCGRDLECLRSLTPEQVYPEAERLLKRSLESARKAEA